MNKDIINKIIDFCECDCPPIKYDNPLLDKNIAKVISKSLLKIIEQSKGNDNNELYKYIRNVCKMEPQGHLPVNEQAIDILINRYTKHLTNMEHDNITKTNKMLDAFLIRNMPDMELSSIYTQTADSEVTQALLNLKLKDKLPYIILNDIIHWNVSCDQPNSRDVVTLRALWDNNNLAGPNDDISIKLKPDIEQQILTLIYEILNYNISTFYDWLLGNENFNSLIEMCSKSHSCFQMCCSIINSVFIKIECHKKIQKFIKFFIENMKRKCEPSLSVFYPVHLSPIVVLLDINIKDLQNTQIYQSYVEQTIKLLKNLDGIYELTMLLSHYPQWFDTYYEIVEGPRGCYSNKEVYIID